MKLLRAAADRNEARRGLMLCEIVSAGMAGMNKGSGPMEKVWNALKKQARM